MSFSETAVMDWLRIGISAMAFFAVAKLLVNMLPVPGVRQFVNFV